MADFVKKDVIDGMATAMLALGCPVKLDIPSWIIKELLARETDPVMPAKIFFVSEAGMQPSLVDEYLNKKGYQYSWGALSEDIFSDELDCDDEQTVGKFGFFPENILKEFPNAAMVQDLFLWVYSHHPLRSKNYDGQESSGDWFVLGFEAEGGKGDL